MLGFFLLPLTLFLLPLTLTAESEFSNFSANLMLFADSLHGLPYLLKHFIETVKYNSFETKSRILFHCFCFSFISVVRPAYSASVL